MMSPSRPQMTGVALLAGGLLAMTAGWNVAVVILKETRPEKLPATLAEWATVIGTTLGAFVLLGLVLVRGLPSGDAPRKRVAFAAHWLPVLRTMLDGQNDQQVACVRIEFTDGSERLLQLERRSREQPLSALSPE